MKPDGRYIRANRHFTDSIGSGLVPERERCCQDMGVSGIIAKQSISRRGVTTSNGGWDMWVILMGA